MVLGSVRYTLCLWGIILYQEKYVSKGICFKEFLLLLFQDPCRSLLYENISLSNRKKWLWYINLSLFAAIFALGSPKAMQLK